MDGAASLKAVVPLETRHSRTCYRRSSTLMENYYYVDSGRRGEGCGMWMWEVVRTWAVSTCLAQQGHHAMIGQTRIQMASRWLHASLDSYTVRSCVRILYRILECADLTELCKLFIREND